MGDLQKFRRRLIRSVARLMHKEKKSPEEVWEQLNKETKCDCQALWNRMKSLTLKKLNRLIAADDRSDRIAPIARMTLTDWLLFDLVLVHEDIDFIGLDRLEQGLVEYKPLIDLYSLVQRFEIEEREGDALADAWTAATMAYNRQGRQCSPMLLQRRWYQLKNQTRSRFYSFWARYRGVERHLESAQEHKPTALQMAIAKTYPNVVCEPFLPWEKSIEKKMIILPETFEAKMGMKNNSQPPVTDKAPDIVLVEPQIETIDLESEEKMDSEKLNKNKDSNEELASNLIAVKQEPPDEDCFSNVKIVATSHVELALQCLENMESLIEEEDEPVEHFAIDASIDKTIELKVNENAGQNSENATVVQEKDFGKDVERDQNELTEEAPLDESDKNAPTETLGAECVSIERNIYISKESKIKISDESEKRISEKFEDNSKQEGEETGEDLKNTHQSDVNKDFASMHVDNLQESGVVETDYEDTCQDADQNYDGEVVEKTDDVDINSLNKFKRKEEETNLDNNLNYNPIVEDDCKEATHTFMSKENLEDKKGKTMKQKEKKTFDKLDAEVINEPTDIPNSEENEEDDILKTVKEKADLYINTLKAQSEVIPEYDINPFNIIPSDLDFVDDGIEFVDDGIELNDHESENGVQNTDVKQQMDKEEDPSFDEKLLLTPVVYTKRLDDMKIFKDADFTLNDIIKIQSVALESKPISKLDISLRKVTEEIKILSDESDDNDDLIQINVQNDRKDSYSESEEDENFRVKSTSYLLKKPKTRTYNPIQLCKNPDFNTRLRRLNFGFFGYPRNRQLLSALKPLTIDLHKAFESKLIGGTLYLEKSLNTQTNTVEDNFINRQKIEEEFNSVLPTATPVQSLINSSKVDIKELLSPPDLSLPIDSVKLLPTNDSIISERNKIISLPDKDKIRQINQQLKTAEVSPIIQGTTAPPVNIVANSSAKQLPGEQGNLVPPVNVVVLDSPLKQVSGNGDQHPIATQPVDTISIDNVSESSNVISVTTVNETDKCSEQTGKTSHKTVDTVPNKDGETRKAYKRKTGPQPSWISRVAPLDFTKNEYLLAPDTLRKVLFVLSSDSKVRSELASSSKNAKLNFFKPKKKSQVGKDVQKQQTAVQSSNGNPPVQSNNGNPDISVNSNSVVKTKIISRRCRSKYCCWSSRRIEMLKNSRVRHASHMCKADQCVCCCKERLEQFHRDPNAKEIPVLLDSEDENDQLQKACESIESVVRQTQDRLMKVQYLEVPAASVVLENEIDVGSQVVVSSNSVLKHPDKTIKVPPLPSKGKSYPSSKTSPQSVELSQSTIQQEPINIPAESLHIPTIQRFFPTRRTKLQVVPCQCNQQSVINKLNRQLILDGSLTCPLHSKHYYRKSDNISGKMRNKVLFLNSKSVSARHTPIFVGKNKILLTSVNMFTSDDSVLSSKAPSPKTPSRLIPVEPLVQSSNKRSDENLTQSSVILPVGVKLKLSENGKLTFSVDPEVTLEDEVLASLPIIVSALQEQIDTAKTCTIEPVNNTAEVLETNNDSIAPVSSQEINQVTPLPEVVSETTDTNFLNINPNQSTSENIMYETNKVNKHSELLEEEQKSEKVARNNSNADINFELTEKHTSQKITEETSYGIECNENIENEPISPHSNNKDNIHNNSDKAKSKSSLLSDLMEMSGISAEDTNLIVQEPTVSNSPTKDIESSEVLVNNKSESVKLSVIQSFEHLKYACENNGVFFKLDLLTSALVAINVSLKKNNSSEKSGIQSVIDLTVDAENEKKSEHSKYLKESAKETVTISKDLNVKPLKLFKSIHSNILSRNKNKRKTLKTVTGNIVRCKPKNPRTNLKNKIEAKIDLVDSDEPLEEEYLVDSSDSELSNLAQKRARSVESTDDSSDDEPLAKKAVRVRNPEYLQNKEEKNTPLVEASFLSTHKNTSNALVDTRTESLPTDNIGNTIMELPPRVTVDSIEMITNEEFEVPTALAFLNDNNSDKSAEEDCILGF